MPDSHTYPLVSPSVDSAHISPGQKKRVTLEWSGYLILHLRCAIKLLSLLVHCSLLYNGVRLYSLAHPSRLGNAVDKFYSASVCGVLRNSIFPLKWTHMMSVVMDLAFLSGVCHNALLHPFQDGVTAVLLAACNGHQSLVQELCESFGADILHRAKVRIMQTVKDSECLSELCMYSIIMYGCTHRITVSQPQCMRWQSVLVTVLCVFRSDCCWTVRLCLGLIIIIQLPRYYHMCLCLYLCSAPIHLLVHTVGSHLSTDGYMHMYSCIWLTYVYDLLVVFNPRSTCVSMYCILLMLYVHP